MSGGGGSSTNTVQKADPWGGQQPYLSQGFNAASDYLNGPTPTYYGGQQVAPFSAATQGGVAGLDNFTQSQPYQTSMQGLLATASGQYLDPNSNPDFQNMVNQSIAAARPSVDSAFAAGGRLGSGDHMAAFSDAATRAATGLGYQNYTTERQNQLQAQSGLPALQMQGLQAQLTGGGLTDAQAQNQINAQMAAYNYNRDARLNQLQNYTGLIQGNFGGTTNTSTQAATNPWMQGVGSGIGLLGAAGQLGQGASGLNSLFGGGSSAANVPGGPYGGQSFYNTLASYE